MRRLKILSLDDLHSRGIPHSARQLARLEQTGAFPQRVRLSGHRYGWVESEIDHWLTDRLKARATIRDEAA